ncbi:MAG: outer membrane protein assembly factor BamE [Candidatus Marinimicrobia bacterium]|nr:outer membrane protein assembly factor BamE [Candidatus Neomarinimicrobiota bacterium]
MKFLFHIIILSIFVSACAVPSSPPPPSPEPSNILTLGTVQSKIRKGMSQAEVLEVLGSPNIVTKNSKVQEVWTYDKVGSSRSSAATVNYGQRTLGQGFLAFLFGGTTSSAAANATNETKSLTVIITFDENKNVSDFTYQSLKY